jgi:hypothetical protein
MGLFLCSFGLDQKNDPDSYRDKGERMALPVCPARAHEEYDSLQMFLLLSE